jgi:hypothetical protein
MEYAFKGDEYADFDGIVLTLGAEEYKGAISPTGKAKSLGALEFLEDWKANAEAELPRALVWDAAGDWKAPFVCRKLAAAGYEEIILVTPEMYFSPSAVKNGEFTYWYGEMGSLPLKAYAQSLVVTAGTEHVILRDVFGGKESVLKGVSLAVEINPAAVDESLYCKLRQKGVLPIRAGDCLAPRSLLAAVREGYLAAEEVFANA